MQHHVTLSFVDKKNWDRGASITLTVESSTNVSKLSDFVGGVANLKYSYPHSDKAFAIEPSPRSWCVFLRNANEQYELIGPKLPPKDGPRGDAIVLDLVPGTDIYLEGDSGSSYDYRVSPQGVQRIDAMRRS